MTKEFRFSVKKKRESPLSFLGRLPLPRPTSPLPSLPYASGPPSQAAAQRFGPSQQHRPSSASSPRALPPAPRLHSLTGGPREWDPPVIPDLRPFRRREAPPPLLSAPGPRARPKDGRAYKKATSTPLRPLNPRAAAIS